MSFLPIKILACALIQTKIPREYTKTKNLLKAAKPRPQKRNLPSHSDRLLAAEFTYDYNLPQFFPLSNTIEPISLHRHIRDTLCFGSPTVYGRNRLFQPIYGVLYAYTAITDRCRARKFDIFRRFLTYRVTYCFP